MKSATGAAKKSGGLSCCDCRKLGEPRGIGCWGGRKFWELRKLVLWGCRELRELRGLGCWGHRKLGELKGLGHWDSRNSGGATDSGGGAKEGPADSVGGATAGEATGEASAETLDTETGDVNGLWVSFPEAWEFGGFDELELAQNRWAGDSQSIA